MKKIGILGIKLSMTQIPSENGEIVPVTAVMVDDNVISQVKLKDSDGYDSCQIAFLDSSEKKLNNPIIGHLKKNGISPKKYLKEVRFMSGFSEGEVIDASIFKEGDEIKITGNSKGKGFAGVIKRYGFALGAMSHGGGYPHRLIGSMGGGRGTNQGIPKGKKMPGRMGNEKITQNSIVQKIDLESKIIFLKGSIPGPKKSLVILSKKV
jgi:large subunit ribosomal protein L3